MEFGVRVNIVLSLPSGKETKMSQVQEIQVYINSRGMHTILVQLWGEVECIKTITLQVDC